MESRKVLFATKANDIIPVKKYRLNSGLTLIIAETEGPLVSGFFCIGKLSDNARCSVIFFLVISHLISEIICAYL